MNGELGTQVELLPALPTGQTIILTKSAPKVLAKAAKSGSISPKEMLRLIPARMTKNPKDLDQATIWLCGLLRSLGIVVVNNQMAEKIQKGILRQERINKSKEAISHLDPYYIRKLYDAEVNDYVILNPNEIVYLSHLARQKGDLEARNKIVVHNLRLARMVAEQYKGSLLNFQRVKVKSGALELLDLIQESNIGLIRAAQDYNASVGTAFSTYAMWWTRQRVLRAIQDTSKTVRIPVHRHEFLLKVMRATERILSNTGRAPEPQEIADMLLVSRDNVEKAIEEMRLREIVSLDQAWDEDDKETAINFIVAQNSIPQADENIEREEALRKVHDTIRLIITRLSALKSITDRDKKIFRMRYGMDDSFTPKTLEEVGECFTLTRERIRQLVEKVWALLETTGLKREMSEAVLTEDGYDCVLRLQELTGEVIKL